MNDVIFLIIFLILLLVICLFPYYLQAVNRFLSKHKKNNEDELAYELQFLRSVQITQKEREAKKYETVKNTSDRYKKVIDLNLSTAWNNILDDGSTVTYLLIPNHNLTTLTQQIK